MPLENENQHPLAKDVPQTERRPGLEDLTEWLKNTPIDSPKATLWERITWPFIEWRMRWSWRGTLRGARDLILDFLYLAVLLAILAACLMVLSSGVALVNHWGRCAFAPVEISPDAADVTVLHVTHRFWLRSSYHFDLHQRRDPEDGDKLVWMVKEGEGWYPASEIYKYVEP